MAEAPLLVVDASVVVKWFVSAGEKGVDEASRLLETHADGEVKLVAPALVAHELLSVLSRGRRGGSELGEAVGAFFDTSVALIAPDRGLMGRAAAHVARHRVSSFDAAYSALAETLGCGLATADRKLARALGGVVETHVV